MSPPEGGISLLYRIEVKGGSVLKVTSVCHSSVSGGLVGSFSSKVIFGYFCLTHSWLPSVDLLSTTMISNDLYELLFMEAIHSESTSRPFQCGIIIDTFGFKINSPLNDDFN